MGIIEEKCSRESRGMPTVFSLGNLETWRTCTRLYQGQLGLAWSRAYSSNSSAGKAAWLRPSNVLVWKLKLHWAVSTACGYQGSRQGLELGAVRMWGAEQHVLGVARELRWPMWEGKLRHTHLSQEVTHTSLTQAHFQSQMLSLCPCSHDLPMPFWSCGFREYFAIQVAMPSSYYSADFSNWMATGSFCLTEWIAFEIPHTYRTPVFEEQGHITASIFNGCTEVILLAQLLNGWQSFRSRETFAKQPRCSGCACQPVLGWYISLAPSPLCLWICHIAAREASSRVGQPVRDL